MLADDADILTAYDFNRHQGINKPFEPSEPEHT